MDGFGLFDWGTGKKYVGNYKNDKRNGFGIYLWNIPQINDGETLKDLNNIKGYIGFFNDGNMNGIGIKISGGKMKYGIWKNGVKIEFIEDEEKEEHIKKHLDKNQKKYSKIFLAKENKILSLLSSVPITIDELIENTGLSPQNILMIL